MKIRIKGDSIRLRLTKSEVDALASIGSVEEHTHMPGGTLSYVLRSDSGSDDLNASFQDNTIFISMPAKLATAWPGNDVVGYRNTISVSDNISLSLLVEKDFKCIDAPAEEDQSDNYEHPNITCS